MSHNTVSKNKMESSNDSWWQFGTSTWLLIGGLLLLNVGFFLHPTLFDTILIGIVSLFDFRTWPWWYLLCLVAVLAFSVRWFLLYIKKINDEFDLSSREEAKWFCRLTGAATCLFVLLIVLHQTGILRKMYSTLNLMFGYGAFSIWALLFFALIFSLIGLFVYLIGKWVATLQID